MHRQIDPHLSFPPTGQWLPHIAFGFPILCVPADSWERGSLRPHKAIRWKTNATPRNKNANPVSNIMCKSFIQGFACSSQWVGRWYLGQIMLWRLPHPQISTLHSSSYPNMVAGNTKWSRWNHSTFRSLFRQARTRSAANPEANWWIEPIPRLAVTWSLKIIHTFISTFPFGQSWCRLEGTT